MTNLEKLYEINFEKIPILQRKIQISEPFTIIKGAAKSGKTYLIYDYLMKFSANRYLYINLNDLRFDTNTILYNMDRFLIQYKDIEILILDNCPELENNFFTNLKTIKSIILTTSKSLYYNGFTTINLYPLDFEEYILFDTKHQNTINSFNTFFKYGNFPEIIQFNETKQLFRNQEILKIITDTCLEFEILKLYIQSSGELKSIFQLFNALKLTHKISKDIFYKISKKFENQNIIYFCQKFRQPKAPKEIYCYNHALIDTVTINKKFNNILANMVFLELNKLYKKIFYLDYIDFYIQEYNNIILAIPFFNDHILLSSKILPKLQELNIKNITIITISITKTIFINEIEAEVIPFYEWALTL
jgi:hypothetical protein